MPAPPSRSRVKAEPQSPEEIAAAIESFLTANPAAVVMEDGKIHFDLRTASKTLTTEYSRCTLQLWDDQQNIVRRVVAVEAKPNILRLSCQRFGQTRLQILDLIADRQRRTITDRETTRTRYLKVLERALTRTLGDWKIEGLRTAMDLERSFGPAYARGLLTRGMQAWAVIGVNAEESVATIDGVLTLGLLWFDLCRQQATGSKQQRPKTRLMQGLHVVVPQGASALTASRMAWLNERAAQYRLWELDERSEDLTEIEPTDTGNITTRLIHAPDETRVRERFAEAAEQILALIPPSALPYIEQRLRSTAELAFLWNGLEFARIRQSFGSGFRAALEITFGSGTKETALTEKTAPKLRKFVAELIARRTAGGDSRDVLYRMQPERWLESTLRRDLAPLTRSMTLPPGSTEAAAPSHAGGTGSYQRLDTFGDPDGNVASPKEALNAQASDALDFRRHSERSEDTRHFSFTRTATAAESRTIPRLDPHHVYTQVPAIAGAGDRGMLDLLGITADGRLAVLELKADEDMHLALQGLDYWLRVRQHHLAHPDPATGLGEFQRHGYFPQMRLSPEPPRLYLVAPALRIHPAVEIVLRYLSPRVDWQLIALDERWRAEIKVVWRRQNSDGLS